ncbi:hypothetical protein OQJ26_11625 [Legionella sp. PATHC038]|uniref:F0F1 ATP synthase subunit B family protein n=1 Tax=Legionella sheltonii TaxID=2992041 RepID=UPI002243A064|nr:hypothetical protein [Legionella sp. PATHC038]MCW8399439.1 hypothetical protein [Legionella sp. PATHC038]
MLIDWFTVIAQVINFLILIWLLKRFLYHPILHAIDAREERIASVIAAASAKEAEAQKERDTLHKQNEEFNQQRALLLKEATDEVTVERKRLTDEARCEVDDLRVQWKESLRREQFNLRQEITTRIEEEVFSLTRKIFIELANTHFESQLIDRFLKNQDEVKEQLASMTKDSSFGVLIRSGFELSSAQRHALEKGVNEIIGPDTDISIQFETSSHLITGIELVINGQKIGWNVADYLSDLQNHVDAFFQEQFKSDFKTLSH